MYTRSLFTALIALLALAVAGCSGGAADPVGNSAQRRVSDIALAGDQYDTSFPSQNVSVDGDDLDFFPDDGANEDAYAAWTFSMTNQSGLQYVKLDWTTAPSLGANVFVWNNSSSSWQILVGVPSGAYYYPNLQSTFTYSNRLTIKVLVDDSDNNSQLDEILLDDSF